MNYKVNDPSVAEGKRSLPAFGVNEPPSQGDTWSARPKTNSCPKLIVKRFAPLFLACGRCRPMNERIRPYSFKQGRRGPLPVGNWR